MERSRQSQMVNLQRVLELETWIRKTNTKLIQVNGQRKYGGPPEVWDGPPPGAQCEVFISKIPRDTYEDLLIPLFSSIGPLWEFRLMMNFSGQNRGFAYAKYGSAAVAAKAIHLLHGYMLEPGHHLSVRLSIEKRQLCLRDLPATTRHKDLLQVLHALVDGVESVSLQSFKSGPGIERTFAIVTFSSHQTASMAKKIVVEAFKRQFSLSISITWQSAVKLSMDKPPPPPKPSKSVLLTPPKPPRLKPNSAQHPVLPPTWARPPSIPPGFHRAVGGPSNLRHPLLPGFSPAQRKESETSSSVAGGCICTSCGYPYDVL
ncbi:dead end protein 1 isoform X1 [Xyrichtys novacula]|uniref:Dead end protein 1 isoform X1 n=1 Tax=Xyrichtys novacula TaxID=13765 RepID=A0AAV1FBH4_XYRNO|nr:dead end protein 1 isoform X1 [Xyrichtys novacula]